MTNPIATIAILIALTVPQRKALGAALVRYVFGCLGASRTVKDYPGPAVSRELALEIEVQILEPTRDQADRNVAILRLLPFLPYIRTGLNGRECAVLNRALAGIGADPHPCPTSADAFHDGIKAAEDQIRALLNPFTEPEIVPPQIREGGDVKAWLDKAIAWAESLPGAEPPIAPERLDPAVLEQERRSQGLNPRCVTCQTDLEIARAVLQPCPKCGGRTRTISATPDGPVPPAPRPLDQATIRRVLDVMSRAGIQVGTADPAVYPVTWDEAFRRIWAQVALDAEGSAEIVHVTWDT